MLPLFFLLASIVRGPADVESLAAAADVVVHAQVVRRTSAFGKGGGQIFTTVLLRTIETWKGEIAPQLAVVVEGGEVGELSQTVSGAANFGDGEEVVVFLNRRSSGVYSVSKLGLGKFAVTTSRVLRDRRGIECQGCAAEQDEFPLDELRVRVLRSR